DRPQLMIPAVPAANRSPGNVVERPALARFHARLMNPRAKHVVVVAHYDSPLRIGRPNHSVSHRALVAFNVELGARGILLLYHDAVAQEPVVGGGEKCPAKRVGVGDGWRPGMDGGLVCSILIG